MALFFLQESSNKNRINNILNRIKEKNEGYKTVLEIPIKIDKKVKNKKIEKLIKKLEKYDIKTVVLSEKLYSVEELKRRLQAKNINIVDGKYLFKLLVEDIICYICKKNETNIEKTEMSILTNEASNINEEIIYSLAQKVKTLNIITNNSKGFKIIEEYLYNEKGIIIKISNNYKTAMNKTNIIVNLDFTEEEINKYLIPIKCTIINIKGNVKIKSKRFNGININNYNIIIPKRYEMKGYNNNHVYETYLLNENYKNARRKIREDKIRIV